MDYAQRHMYIGSSIAGQVRGIQLRGGDRVIEVGARQRLGKRAQFGGEPVQQILDIIPVAVSSGRTSSAASASCTAVSRRTAGAIRADD